MNANEIQRDFVPSAAAVPEMSDEDEFETVVYTGPGVPVSSTVVVEDTVPKKGDVPPAVQVKPPPPVNVRLAQIATEYGGLLSPEFFLNGLSPSDSSSRGTPSSSESVTPFSSGRTNFKAPFSFPKVDTGPKMTAARKKTTDQEQIDQKLERVQILDEHEQPPPEKEEPCWEEWPQTYISSNKGFILGIKPGIFFKDKSSPCFYVRMPHRSNYEVILTNKNPIPCDVDLYVNGKLTNAQRIPADSTRIVDGPQYSEYAFKLFRAKEAPPGKNVTVGDRANGHVKAVFTPCRVQSKRVGGVDSPRLRSTSEPSRSDTSLEEDIFEFLNNPDDASKKRAFTVASAIDEEGYRTLDLSRVTEAVTLLQGSQSKTHFVKAPEMPTDLSKQVTLQLRLIASLDEEVTATDEEIYCLEPPPLPS